MSAFLRESPSSTMTRVMLFAGLTVFIVMYSYILNQFKSIGVEPETFSKVWLSFDVATFHNFLSGLQDQGHLRKFVWCFSLNVVSMTGFLFTFFALNLLLARQLPESSKLARVAYGFPVISILIAVMDIIPSLLFTMEATHLPAIRPHVVNLISGGYMGRVILLYVLIIWMIVAGIAVFRNKLRVARTPSQT